MKNDIPVAGCAHQAGTCRFGDDPSTSVLDVNCKAHELDNLYVVDTSVFPSIGAVNPALTAMANSLRVGEHLLDRLGAATQAATRERAAYEDSVERKGAAEAAPLRRADRTTERPGAGMQIQTWPPPPGPLTFAPATGVRVAATPRTASMSVIFFFIGASSRFKVR